MAFYFQRQRLSECIFARKDVSILVQSPIPVVGTKFLGVIFYRKLSFVPHLKYIKKKTLKALNLLNVIENTEWGADREVMLRLDRP